MPAARVRHRPLTTRGIMASLRGVSAVLSLVCLCLASAAEGQGTRADYERSASLRRRTEGTVFKASVTPHWDADGNRFWYRNDLAGGRRDFIRVDAVRGTRQPAFDHARLAAALSKTTEKQLDAERLLIDTLHFADGSAELRLLAAGQWWQWNDKTGELIKSSAPKTAEPSGKSNPRDGAAKRKSRARRNNQSPDGKWVAFAEGHNLYLRARDTAAGDK